MMPNVGLFEELEIVLAEKRPYLAERLRPGLPEAKIRKTLSKGKVEGGVEPIVALYEWRDGTVLSNSRPPMDITAFRSAVSLLPKQTYYFISLERAVNDFDFVKQIAKKYPTAAPVTGRYFPILWNAATGWFALDLNSETAGRVAIIQPKAQDACHDAYDSFEAFISDVVRANREDDFLNYSRYSE